MTDEEFLKLKSDFEILRNEISSKLPGPETMAELKATIAALGEKQALSERIAALEQGSGKFANADATLELRTAVTAATEKLALSERFAKVEEEHNSWKTLAKYLSITLAILGGMGAILGGIGSFFGVKFAISTLSSRANAEIRKLDDFQSDLVFGLAYREKQPELAVPYLERCFDKKPDEEPIIQTLLVATDQADDWSTERRVLDKLTQGPFKSKGFQYPGTYNIVGVAYLNSALSNPQDYERARQSLERGLTLVRAENLYDIWYLNLNLWRYYLAVGNDKSAEEQIKKLKTLTPPSDFTPWKEVKDWKWIKELFQSKPELREKTRKMYEAIPPPANATKN